MLGCESRCGLSVSRAAGRALGGGLPAFLDVVALSVHLKDVDAVSEAVRQGPGQRLRAEDLGPLVEGQGSGPACLRMSSL